MNYLIHKKMRSPYKFEFYGVKDGESLTDKCIILDVDETLIHSMDMAEYKMEHFLDNPKLCQSIFITHMNLKDARYDLWAYKRPHLQEFLTFCFSYFKIVAVWSAGEYDYVHSVVNHIFKRIRRPHLIFTRPDCKQEKELTKPIIEMINQVPGLSEYMNLANTVIIDDRDTNFLPNPYNGILIPAFSPKGLLLELDDDHLLHLIKWFKQRVVRDCKDIRALAKDKIFTRSVLI